MTTMASITLRAFVILAIPILVFVPHGDYKMKKQPAISFSVDRHTSVKNFSKRDASDVIQKGGSL